MARVRGAPLPSGKVGTDWGDLRAPEELSSGGRAICDIIHLFIDESRFFFLFWAWLRCSGRAEPRLMRCITDQPPVE
jgi:hypothetical protein